MRCSWVLGASDVYNGLVTVLQQRIMDTIMAHREASEVAVDDTNILETAMSQMKPIQSVIMVTIHML
jgi:hypothetical protein